MLLDEYKKSLKMPEAEEMFDLFFFRPIAYVLVKGLYRTPISPNHVTALSLLAGVVAAYFFSRPFSSTFVWGALLYALANILDCADGQLARLQQSGTLFGRVWDGVADYISSTAIFLALGVTLANGIWYLVLLAGVSSAVHSMVFDRYQSEFIARKIGEENFLRKELDRFTEEIRRMQEQKKGHLKILLLNLYILYLRIQNHFPGKERPGDIRPGLRRSAHNLMIRLWSFLGPTTNRTVLIVCALLDRLELYLWAVLSVGNLWLVVCYLLQRRVYRVRETETPA